MKYTTAQLHEILKELPPDVNEAIGSVNYIDTLLDIEKRYRLHLDQADALGNEIFKLMLGLTSPQQFIDAIVSAVKIPRETAKLIATEVNEKIFRPVRESLMQIHKAKEAETSVSSAPIADVATPTIPAVEIPERHDISDNAKNKMEETFPEKETKRAPEPMPNIMESKLTEPFSLPVSSQSSPAVSPPQKTDTAPDPYREAV